MNSGLLSTLNSGLDALGFLTKEPITLGSTVYNCFITGATADGVLFEEGGATDASTAQVAIKQTDLAQPPVKNSFVTFRGQLYRINMTKDLTTTWELYLLQQNA